MDNNTSPSFEKVAFGAGFASAMKTLGGGKALAAISTAAGLYALAKRPKLIQGEKYKISHLEPY